MSSKEAFRDEEKPVFTHEGAVVVTGENASVGAAATKTTIKVETIEPETPLYNDLTAID